jgi:DNA replication protein DnaC
MIRQIKIADRERLYANLKRLKLRKCREILDEICELAAQEEPGYMDFFAYLVEREIEARELTQFQKRLKAARFRGIKSLEEFDFGFQTSVSRQTMMELASLNFIAAKENICFCGPSGVGKSHLATALGYDVKAERKMDKIAG